MGSMTIPRQKFLKKNKIKLNGNKKKQKKMFKSLFVEMVQINQKCRLWTKLRKYVKLCSTPFLTPTQNSEIRTNQTRN